MSFGNTTVSRFKRLAAGSIFTVFLAAIALLPAHAQTDASLSGIVHDTTGAGVQGATIIIKNLETGTQRDVQTDSEGRYHAPSLAVGRYELTADKTGFRTEHRTGITLVVGQQAEIDLTLQVGNVHQTVEVSSEPAVVVVTTEDTSGLVGERQVKELPLNGRSYDQLLTLNPGIVNYTSQRAGGIGTSNSVVGNMFAASGHRPQENLFLLNGVEFTSASEINNTPGGASGQLLGVDAVREFEVVKDTYGAEYGKRPGAQVSIVTASGTNQLHGTVYEFARNSALDARNFFDQGSIPDFQRNVFGGSLGGPIKKDKIFIFGNYEGFRQNLGLSDVTLVPDDASQSQRGCERSTTASVVAGGEWTGDPDCYGRAKWHRKGVQQSHAEYSRGFWDFTLRPDFFQCRFVFGSLYRGR